MSEKKKAVEEPKKVSVERRHVAVLLKNFSKSEQICPQHWQKSIKSWCRGQIVWNEAEIDELVSLNAPIEVFYQDVNRTAKN